MNNALLGKVVLITGGTSGIGLATAHLFAREGAHVVINGRDAERGEKAARALAEGGAAAHFVCADVSKAVEVEALIRKVIDLHGRLDCAVNNAGTIDGAFKLTDEFTEGEFETAVATNLKSVWLSMKYELRQMKSQIPVGGAIVNTSSVSGLGGVAGAALYSAAKSGIIALTKSAAQEFGGAGVRVNAVAPGPFRTPLLQFVFRKNIESGDAPGENEIEKRFAQRTALGRIGSPHEAGEAIVWLCSDAASYVTGSCLIVDGGITAPYR